MSGPQRPSYPRPPAPLGIPHPLLVPHAHLPLYRSPKAAPPNLPTRPPVTPATGWRITQHVIPAAYPREYPGSTGELSRSATPFSTDQRGVKESKEEKKERMNAEAKKILQGRLKAARWSDEDLEEGGKAHQTPPLWLGAERWVRENVPENEDGVTLVLLHANGFHKETFHPTLKHLLQLEPITSAAAFGMSTGSSAPETKQYIQEVWILDDVHHGTSVDLNAGLLGVMHSWADGGRDVIGFLEHYLPDEVTGDLDQVLKVGKSEAGRKRKVIGVGHSMGGVALIHAAHARPDLFHALCLIDPTALPIIRTKEDIEAQDPYLVTMAMKRRHVWESRKVAEDTLRPSPFFAPFHPSVYSTFISHGLVPVGPSKDDSGPVTLATPPWCETVLFAETMGLGQAWDRLSELKNKVGFIMAGNNSATLGKAVTAELVWKAVNSSNEIIKGSGHLERPAEVAEAIWRFLGTTISSGDMPRAKL